MHIFIISNQFFNNIIIAENYSEYDCINLYFFIKNISIYSYNEMYIQKKFN